MIKIRRLKYAFGGFTVDAGEPLPLLNVPPSQLERIGPEIRVAVDLARKYPGDWVSIEYKPEKPE